MSVSKFQLAQSIRPLAYLLVSILVVKLGLDLSTIGELETYWYLGGLLTFWWLSPILQHILYTEEETLFRQSNVIRGVTMLAGGILMLIYFSVQYILGDTAIARNLHLFAPFAVFILGQSILHYRVNMLFRHGKMNSMLVLTSIFYLIFVLSFFPIIATKSIFPSIKLLGILGLTSLIVDILFWNPIWSKTIMSDLRLLVHGVWPLMIYVLLGQAPIYFDAWYVQYMEGSGSSFAIFRYGARELPIILPILISLGQAHVSLIRKNKSNLDDLKKDSARYTLIIGTLVLGLIAVSSYAYTWVYSSEFTPAAALFDLMLLLVFSKLMYPQSIILAHDGTTVMNKIALGEILLNIILSISLYGFMGIRGVVLATVIAYFFERFLQIFWVHKQFGIPAGRYIPWKIWIPFFCAAVVMVFIKSYCL